MSTSRPEALLEPGSNDEYGGEGEIPRVIPLCLAFASEGSPAACPRAAAPRLEFLCGGDAGRNDESNSDEQTSEHAFLLHQKARADPSGRARSVNPGAALPMRQKYDLTVEAN